MAESLFIQWKVSLELPGITVDSMRQDGPWTQLSVATPASQNAQNLIWTEFPIQTSREHSKFV